MRSTPTAVGILSTDVGILSTDVGILSTERREEYR
jgi:hypothetical protein